MTKSALEAARELLVDGSFFNEAAETRERAQRVSRALLRLSSERDEMVERCAQVADGERQAHRQGPWNLNDWDEGAAAAADKIGACIRSLSKPQEEGE